MAQPAPRDSSNGDRPLRVLVAAGGTAGHLFPARALAEELAGRGCQIHLVTDRRGSGFDEGFPARAIYLVKAATPVGGSPAGAARALVTLAQGVFAAYRLIRRLRPDIVVGFGGYPTVPPLLAAWGARVPIVIHDQNAVMGRANRVLARVADAFATSVPAPKLAGAPAMAKAVHTGNPVRRAVLGVRDREYRPPRPSRPAGAEPGRLRLVVFGGSQGAQVFADAVPRALALLDRRARARIDLVAQCRKGGREALEAAYRDIGVDAEIAPFFGDMPGRIAGAHLVICRSGASTTTELAVIGRPAIMVPLPGAIDHDQRENARGLADNGAGWVVEEEKLTPQFLAAKIKELWGNPRLLSEAAAAARAIGRPDAAAVLGALVRHVAARRRLAQFHPAA